MYDREAQSLSTVHFHSRFISHQPIQSISLDLFEFLLCIWFAHVKFIFLNDALFLVLVINPASVNTAIANAALVLYDI